MPKKTGALDRFTRSDFYKIAELDVPADKVSAKRRWIHASLKSFHFNPGELSVSWRNPTDAWVVLNCRWYHNYLPAESVNEPRRLVRFRREAVNALLHSHPSHGTGVHNHVKKALDWRTFYDTAYYRLYNVFETMAEPGEFYLDRGSGKLYYVPREGEVPATADVVAPRLNQLLVAKSDADKEGYIKGLRLRALTFSHTTLKPENHRGTGNNYHSSGDAVVHLTGVAQSQIWDCELSHLGEFALAADWGTRDLDVVGNHFHDLGCGAFKSFGFFTDNPKVVDPRPTGTMRIRFTDNEIHDGDHLLSGHTAVVVSKTRESVFAFNHVHDFNYNAINLGGGLGRNFQFSMFDVLVLNNHIHDLGRGHYNGNDMAGIYLHGIGLGVEVRGNVIHDVTCTSYGANGIYLDAAASNFLIENNIVYNTNTDAVNLKGFHNRVVNNIFYNTHDAGLRNTDAFSEEVGATIERNVIVPRGAAVYRCRWGRDLEQMHLATRNNVVWSLDRRGDLVVEQIGIYGLAHAKQMAFDEWREGTGQGQGTVVADPLFADPAPAQSGDFTLKPDSPAPARISHQASSRECVGCVRSRASRSAGDADVLGSTSRTPCKGSP